MIRVVRKPPSLTKAFNERLKISLAGNHTFKQKTCMCMQAIYHLDHEHGFRFAGPTDVYIGLIDQDGHPLTRFANGNLIADYSIVIDSPYHCAADEHGI